MFNPDKRFEPNVERDAVWNRGAYLVEAMGHCGECHTPRNLGFALNNRQKFAGAVQAGWRAYNITPDRSSGVGAWSDTDLLHYLSTGHADGRGTASGPMGEAVDESLKFLKAGDLQAMVAYLRTVAGIATGDLPEPRSRSRGRVVCARYGLPCEPKRQGGLRRRLRRDAMAGPASVRSCRRQPSRATRAVNDRKPRPTSHRSSSARQRHADGRTLEHAGLRYHRIRTARLRALRTT